ncbi:heliorhodopsin HeR [soil metagenome]
MSVHRYQRLRRFNFGVGVLHLVQAAVLVALSNDLALPVFATLLTDDPVAQEGLGEPELLFSIRVGFAVALFVAFAAADHLLVAGPLRRWYEGRLDVRANTARWVEYSISSSIMIVLIAQLTGIWDLAALGAIFAVNSAMILFGLVMERREEPETADWTAFWSGSAVGAVPWVLLGYYIVAAGGEVPGFVYVIYVVQFLLFFTFALNMWLQYRQVGRWRDYVFGEYVYIVLSLAAKSLLAWLVFANVLRS